MKYNQENTLNSLPNHKHINVMVNDLIAPIAGMTIDDFTKQVASEWEEKLKAYLKENLRHFGFKFETDDGFIDFCKKRVSRIGFEDRRNYYEFYLDYFDPEHKGQFVGSYSDNQVNGNI